MKKLLIASNNKHKVKEIKQILKGFSIDVVSLNDEGINIDPEETGSTFTENALIKARTIFNIAKIPVLADDSGIIVSELGSKPGVYSKRYAGEDSTDEENNKKVVRQLKALKKESSSARFVCSLAYVDENAVEYTFEGECSGIFILEPKGSNGFGYDPYFYVREYNSTMAELEDWQKNEISHRGKALLKFSEFLKDSII